MGFTPGQLKFIENNRSLIDSGDFDKIANSVFLDKGLLSAGELKGLIMSLAVALDKNFTMGRIRTKVWGLWAEDYNVLMIDTSLDTPPSKEELRIYLDNSEIPDSCVEKILNKLKFNIDNKIGVL